MKSGWILLALPIALLAVLVQTYPFADELTAKKISISELSAVQRSNIQLAANAINSVVLKPGEEFSFNRAVGPRTEGRGYRPASSYLGPESIKTIGGGICLVSSALYQAALESGITVEERVPHLRTIKTVPAGYDATVWYGQADLKFKNTFDFPVQITTQWSRQTLSVSLRARKPNGYRPMQLQRIVSSRTPSSMVVELLRKEGDRLVLVSRDHYSIAQ